MDSATMEQAVGKADRRNAIIHRKGESKELKAFELIAVSLVPNHRPRFAGGVAQSASIRKSG